MIAVNDIQMQILEALAEYRFLTNSQLLNIGLGTKSKSTIWKHTNILRSKSRGYINHISYGTIIRLGRVENVLYLTKKGKQLLADVQGRNASEIYVPSQPQLTDDYYHRIQTINFHIELSKACAPDRTLDFFHPYFIKQKRGRSFRSLTTVDLKQGEQIVPDAVFKINSRSRSRHFLFELHNGRSIKRLKEQIYIHAIALTNGSTHKAFGIPREQFYYVLIVLDNESAYESLIDEMSKLKSQYQNIHQFFLCKHLAQIEQLTFWENWKSILGEVDEIRI